MLFEEFLRQEEKRLSGTVVKVPVNIGLRNRKAELIYELFGKYWRYRHVSREDRTGEKFSERIHKAKDLAINPDDLYKFLTSFTINDYRPILRNFLHDNYEPPKWEEPVGLYDGNTTVWFPTFLEHTLVCLLYQVNVVNTCYIYPAVDEFVNFAETQLIVKSLTKITDIATKAARSDGGKKEKKNKPVLEAVKQYLIENPKLSSKNSEQISNQFRKKYKKNAPLEITLDKAIWEVFDDGEKIVSRVAESHGNDTVKNIEKSISYSRFRQNYISEAKKEISPL